MLANDAEIEAWEKDSLEDDDIEMVE